MIDFFSQLDSTIDYVLHPFVFSYPCVPCEQKKMRIIMRKTCKYCTYFSFATWFLHFPSCF